ncbi:MAG TPA: response regulator transcription factor [Rhodocyclaceae bacterium]|jgi:DNA-binding NarL/FixJ family response regulator|nr:response regulator transcription factor [Rhodocyclaceae bacterium]
MQNITSTMTATSSPSPIRVLIADDQALIRRGMSLILAAEHDIEVVGQAADGAEAVMLTLQLRPDVVLMDLHMPRKGGVIATREITSQLPNTRVMVLTTFDTDEMVFDAVRAGAQAYLLKDASEAEVLDTIRAVHRGESRLTSQIAGKVMDQFRLLANRVSGADGELPEALSPLPSPQPEKRQNLLSEKEERVLELIAEGMSNKQIANTIYLAEGTVKNYVSRIMEKLHANTRTELAIMTLRNKQE